VIIEEHLKQDFLDDLSKIEFNQYICCDPMSVGTGTIIKIIFNDDSYQLITHYWTDTFNSKGEQIDWVKVSRSEKEFLELVNKYTENS
jgi:S-ribosylhomocysteine lyase LuxS involved in autoinducer biosynthesis